MNRGLCEGWNVLCHINSTFVLVLVFVSGRGLSGIAATCPLPPCVALIGAGGARHQHPPAMAPEAFNLQSTPTRSHR